MHINGTKHIVIFYEKLNLDNIKYLIFGIVCIIVFSIINIKYEKFSSQL